MKNISKSIITQNKIEYYFTNTRYNYSGLSNLKYTKQQEITIEFFDLNLICWGEIFKIQKLKKKKKK